jgi:DNA-binding NtrC family response regulator
VERREREQQDTAAPSVWIASRSPMMRRTLGLVESVAPTETTVCMRGEVGVGKEVLARLLHEWSPRGSAPMCSVNCATFPESQLDAEIFGIDRDPLSGAVRQRRGLVELAAGGTLFLDEIDALSVGMQTKVLQMLEDREFVRIGGVEVLHADLRIIASTSRSLEALVQQGRFDRNLYRWLMQVPLPVPPLRERPDDIPELATFLLRRIARAQGRPAARFSTAVVPKLLRHEWPGNVTELEQVLARALARSGGTEVRELDPASLAHAFRTQRDPEATAVDLSPLQDPTSFAVLLLAARGNAKTAAAIAGVDRGAFYARLVAMQADPLARSMFN